MYVCMRAISIHIHTYIRTYVHMYMYVCEQKWLSCKDAWATHRNERSNSQNLHGNGFGGGGENPHLLHHDQTVVDGCTRQSSVQKALERELHICYFQHTGMKKGRNEKK